MKKIILWLYKKAYRKEIDIIMDRRNDWLILPRKEKNLPVDYQLGIDYVLRILEIR